MLSALARKLLAVLWGYASVTLCYAADPTHLHGWQDKEISMLKNLWLGNQQLREDQSNRVLNHPLAISLGHRIFFDKKFSRNGEVACASCHQPDKYFTDGRPTGQGIDITARNTPTVVGASQQVWFFHDGRSDSLWSQALGPLENALEHGGDRSHYAHIVYADARYRLLYEKLFGAMPHLDDYKRFPLHAGPVQDKQAHQAWQSMHLKDQQLITQIFVNLGKALAAYQHQLQPAASRLDNYIKAVVSGDHDNQSKLLSNDEVNGLRLFIGKANCTICHHGPMLSDGGFHNVATPAVTGKQYDWGRYQGAQQLLKSPFNCRSIFNDAPDKQCAELQYMVKERHETLGSMKTPSLRNVSKTAPYMHAGQYATLKQVLQHYNDPPPLNYRQSDLFLDIDLSEEELRQLEAFFSTLNSEIASPQELLRPPEQ